MVSANKFGEINSCTGDSSNIHEALFCVMGHCKFIHSFTHSFVYSMNVCIGSLSCVRHWVDKPKSLSQARSLLSQGWCLVRAHVHAHACVRTHTHTHTQGQFLSRLFLYFQMSWTYSLIWSIFNSIELNFFCCFWNLPDSKLIIWKNQWARSAYIWSIAFWQRYWSNSIGKGYFFSINDAETNGYLYGKTNLELYPTLYTSVNWNGS